MKIYELKHPLVSHKLAILRNKKTSTKEFREIIEELSSILCYEALKDAKTSDVMVDTPLAKTKCKMIDENNYAFVLILRAGMGMLDGVTRIMPNARIGHIGMYRDEKTLEPHKYYYKVPKNISEKEVLVLDPMLATGGTAIDAIEELKSDGVKKIKFLCIIASPEGIKKLHKAHPDVSIYCTSIDEKLNDKGYILPGLGDAGDRIYGTVKK